jgi:hypothetical protein
MTAKLEIPLESVLKLVEEFERLDTELGTYRLLFAALKESRVEDAQTLDTMLAASRQSSPLLESMRRKYDAVREMFREQELGALGQKKIDQLIEQLKPTDPLN